MEKVASCELCVSGLIVESNKQHSTSLFSHFSFGKLIVYVVCSREIMMMWR